MANIIVRNMEGYNHGLGCRERDVKEKIKMLRDQGVNLECIGNERPTRNNPKANWAWMRQERMGMGSILSNAGVSE